MKHSSLFSYTILCLVLISLTGCSASLLQNNNRKTVVTIEGEQFHINGTPTYAGRMWTTSYGGKYSVEGLLMNSRMVQGIFDDLNQQTLGQWIYPDTKEWDPERNTREFTDAMASWREHGLLAFTLNLQGGCPYGYCKDQPWDNSAFSPDGSLRNDFMDRLGQIINRADELGMVVILGYFYFGQDDNLSDEAAVINAVENATRWVLDKGYTNVIVEINNECNISYDHEILRCTRVQELIQLAKGIKVDGRSLYVSTSLGGGSVPPDNIIEASDFILLHGNGVRDPQRMFRMIREVRQKDSYKPMPIVNNEDDQPWRTAEQGWNETGNNMVESIKNFASWGYFDFRSDQEHNDYNLGYQSIPVNWQISSERKRNFFDLLAEITGSRGTPEIIADFSGDAGSIKISIGEPENGNIEKVMVIVNNKVVYTGSTASSEFSIDEIPAREHWVKIRAVYDSGDRKVIIESPYYRNPWWPYGGPLANKKD